MDPLLRNKREFGVRIIGHTKRYFSIALTTGSLAAKAFGMNNPFIYEKEGRYRGANFIEPELPLSPERHDQLYDEYHKEGLTDLPLFDAGAGGDKRLAQMRDKSADAR